jgi:hypothetical protein
MSRTSIGLRLVFVGLCVIALLVGASAYWETDVQNANERRFGGQILTMSLGFPTAFFGAGFISDTAHFFGINTFDVAAAPLVYVRDWSIVALLGYVQWFVILPALLRMIRSGMRAKKEKGPK